MPKRTDINKIMIVGSGPIIIGQACEFDYSGTQGCKALREEGYEVVLVNSNPATIMTDPEVGDRTYIEPITWQFLEKIIEKEKPDALLPTLGGQTGLNAAYDLAKEGVVDKYGVELIGANLEVIQKTEDRQLFKDAMTRIGLDVPRSGIATTIREAENIANDIGFPLVIRPAYTLGGSGGGIVFNMDEYTKMVLWGLEMSPINQVLIEQSVIGWKEFELEVMRDVADNVVIICSIENFDPMGVHTGDSITVAPAQTLTDKEYQIMRDAALKIMREVGVETGGSNIQFAVNPENGDLVVIEVNPRVSRSSALASKATGFPIAKIAAKLAVGMTLDEIPNDITKVTPASFEPTIDYCVVKIPRFAFEKFPAAENALTTQMKSVGESMSIGRTFKEALQKGLRSLETGRFGLGSDGKDNIKIEDLVKKLRTPNSDRIFYIKYALESNMSLEKLFNFTKIDPWFLFNMKQIVEFERVMKKIGNKFRNSNEGNKPLSEFVSPELMEKAKKYGYSDIQLGHIFGSTVDDIKKLRDEYDINVTYKRVDTCGAEFVAHTPYMYSTYESECESMPTDKKKIIILGGGPNRIGQGIEFDYCCVHGVFALKEAGYETIMVNSNPETVSTDYDTSDRLYFEPITLEDVMNIIDKENPFGVIVQFGGQTPLKLAIPLMKRGVNILGTSPEMIDFAEDREKFGAFLKQLKIPMPDHGIARSFEEATDVAEGIGYPVMVRPSYVLGGRAMEIVYNLEMLEHYFATAVEASDEHPVLIDKFLEDAAEVDVDAVCDGESVTIGGIMEHIEEAGIHSGDSACVIPTKAITDDELATIREYTHILAKELKVVGLMNIQYAIKDNIVYVLEVNPRASRTVPFVSKAIGRPLAKIAARVMVGQKLSEIGYTEEIVPEHISVKEAVLPFIKLPGVDTVLGPEMKSTGEVMGIADNFGEAFAKAQIAASQYLPTEGTAFISLNEGDKDKGPLIAEKFVKLGFKLMATEGTARNLKEKGFEVIRAYKVNEGRPNVVDFMKNNKVDIVINTPLGRESRYDEQSIRTNALQLGIPCITTTPAAHAALDGIAALKKGPLGVKAIQDYHSAMVKK